MVVKVLMFGWEFPPNNSGGLGVACKGLVDALSEMGTEITFVLPRQVSVEQTQARMMFAGVEHLDVEEIPSPMFPYANSESYRRVWEHLDEHRHIYAGALPEEIRRYGQEGAKVAEQSEFDVIHAHEYLSFLAGVEAKKSSGKPLVLHVHATEWDRSGGNVNPELYELERYGFEHADRIVAVSNWTKQVILDQYGVSADRIEVVHNGIAQIESGGEVPAIRAFKEAGYQAVLFVGRMTIMKGPDYFVDLAKRVLAFRPKTIFVISGSGDMEAQIMEQAARSRISDKVIFTGFLRGGELRSVYQMADLYVLPSVSEPFGLTPLESVMNGTPVLLSKQSGISEVLTHALSANFWDVDDMTDQVCSVLDHQTLKDTLVSNGAKNVADITWTQSAKRCLEVYEAVLGRNR